MVRARDNNNEEVKRGIMKAIQRSVLTYLQSSAGLGICLIGLFLTAIAAFQYGEVSVLWISFDAGLRCSVARVILFIRVVQICPSFAMHWFTLLSNLLQSCPRRQNMLLHCTSSCALLCTLI